MTTPIEPRASIDANAKGRSIISGRVGLGSTPVLSRRAQLFTNEVFMAKLSEMDDETAAALLLKAYRNACDCYDSEEHGNHPSQAVNSWIRNARDSAARDENTGLGPKYLEPTDHGADDPSEFAGKPPNPQRAAQDAERVALDEATEECRIRNSGAADMESQLVLMHARRTDPRKVRAVARAVPGYDRLK